MNNEQIIEKLRQDLYVELAEMEDRKYSAEFEKKLFRLLELCVFSMLESEDSFFASILIQMKRAISFDLSYAMSSVPYGQYFVLYINPEIFLECNLKQMQALIKHEVYHIISKHHLRAAALRSKYSSLAISLAMDISINQYIINLPAWAETLEGVSLSYNVDLEEERTLEEYTDEIQKAMNKLKKVENKDNDAHDEKLLMISELNTNDVHDLWEKNMEIVDEQQVNEVLKKMIDNAYKGKVPKSIDEIIAKLYAEPQITWKDYLKRMLGKIPYGHKKTTTRKDRRQPDRLDLRGRITSHTANIIIAIDISGSISDREIETIMAEVFSIVKSYKSEITIIECDSEIRRVYSVRNTSQVRKRIDTKGGTKFSPVFDYIKKKNLRDHVLIYFTDGVGEEELTTTPLNGMILWVLTGKTENLSLKKPPGIVLSLSKREVKEEINMYEYIRNEMRDIRTEWAK